MALPELFSTIEFQMSLLLFVALGGYLLASRINQSAVIGEILLGIIIGPSLLGWITYTDFVSHVAHLGAVILLFVIGMEFRVNDIFNIKYGFIALVGVVVPWIGGYLLSLLFGFDTTSAIFVGTALTATSIAVTANVLREMNLLQSDVAKAIIGAAVIDDVLSLLVLSMTQQVAAGTLSFITTSFVFISATAFLLLGTIVGLLILNPVIRKFDKSKFAKKFPETVFIFTMMFAFLYALGAEAIGLSSIVGAFIAGMVLGRVTVKQGRDHKQGAEYLHIIFASIFFISLGILADLRALTLPVIVFLILLTIVAVGTKVIGCSLPARLIGFSKKDSAAIGWGMSPRGEVAMIVALLGLNAGLIKQDIYIALVLMSLLTTVLTPIVLRNWIYKKTATTSLLRLKLKTH